MRGAARRAPAPVGDAGVAPTAALDVDYVFAVADVVDRYAGGDWRPLHSYLTRNGLVSDTLLTAGLALLLAIYVTGGRIRR